MRLSAVLPLLASFLSPVVEGAHPGAFCLSTTDCNTRAQFCLDCGPNATICNLLVTDQSAFFESNLSESMLARGLLTTNAARLEDYAERNISTWGHCSCWMEFGLSGEDCSTWTSQSTAVFLITLPVSTLFAFVAITAIRNYRAMDKKKRKSAAGQGLVLISIASVGQGMFMANHASVCSALVSAPARQHTAVARFSERE